MPGDMVHKPGSLYMVVVGWMAVLLPVAVLKSLIASTTNKSMNIQIYTKLNFHIS